MRNSACNSRWALRSVLLAAIGLAPADLPTWGQEPVRDGQAKAEQSTEREEGRVRRKGLLDSSGPEKGAVLGFLNRIKAGRAEAERAIGDIMLRGRTSMMQMSWKEGMKEERTPETLPPPDWCQFLLVHKGRKRRLDVEYIETRPGSEQLATVYRLMDGEAFYKLDSNALDIVGTEREQETWEGLADDYFGYENVHNGLAYQPLTVACQTLINRLTQGADADFWKGRVLRCYEEDGLLVVENDRLKDVAGSPSRNRYVFWVDPRRGYHVARAMVEMGGQGRGLNYREEARVELTETAPGIFLATRATRFVSETGTVAKRDDRAGWMRRDMEVASFKLGDFKYSDGLFKLESLPVPKNVYITDRRDPQKAPVGGIPVETLDKRVKVGDPAPTFRVKTVGGKPLSLDDYRDKYILLDFWATWCGPCLKQTPHLKEIYESFGDDKRVAMIGLSLDDEPEAPRKYAEQHGLRWVQGFLGRTTESEVLAEYGVSAIPSIWLIGPDGKVIAKDLVGEKIKAALAKSLGRP